ncbi:hypothetical protein LINPERPRIM_LOCUS25128 [Linum perenne]
MKLRSCKAAKEVGIELVLMLVSILKGSCCLPIVCIVGVAGCGTGLKLGSDSLGTLQLLEKMRKSDSSSLYPQLTVILRGG